MSQLVISIELTIYGETKDGETNGVQIHSIKDSQGNDVTTDFCTYCQNNGFSLKSQQEIEDAAAHFSQSQP